LIGRVVEGFEWQHLALESFLQHGEADHE
jgi:hypothetical protein